MFLGNRHIFPGEGFFSRFQTMSVCSTDSATREEIAEGTVHLFTVVTTQGMCRCEKEDGWKKNTSNIIGYENGCADALPIDCRAWQRIAAPILVILGG